MKSKIVCMLMLPMILTSLVFATVGKSCTDQWFKYETHTVIRGDTLAKIAQEYLGDYRKWKLLVKINSLKILDNNVVLIYPGQVIKLKIFTKNDINNYRQTTKAFIEDWVLQVKKLHQNPDLPESLSHEGFTHKSIYKAIEQYKKRILYLRKRATKLYVAEIYQRALIMGRGDYPYLKGELWQKERQAALLLIAIGWQESAYRYVHGQHGEIGWFQVKPMTAYTVTREMWTWLDKKDALHKIKGSLMDNPKYVMAVVDKLLCGHPTFVEALANGYNKGKLKYNYARMVLHKYHKLSKRISR